MNRFAWFKPEDIEEYIAHLKKENVNKVLIIGDGISLDKNFSEVIQKNNFDFEVDLRNKIKPGIEDKKIENLANKYEYEFLSIKKSIYELIKEMEVTHKKINILIDQHHLTLETSKYISERNKKKLKKFLER